jgi:hypothetical protein
MTAVLPRVATAALLGLTSACVQHYRPPTANQPHAVLKVRRAYERQAGVSLSEHLEIGQFRAFESGAHAREATQARTDAVLAHPKPDTFSFTATFSHTEPRLVQETYYTQEPYTASESYSCGFGSQPRTCYRTVTHYRSVPKTRMVTRAQTIVDGTCSRAVLAVVLRADLERRNGPRSAALPRRASEPVRTLAVHLLGQVALPSELADQV